MLKAQEEAKRRVMEMQSRSRFLSHGGEEPRPSQQPPPPEPRRPPPAPASGSPDPLLSADTDKLLLLSLCLLLQREDADPFLLMALLYIAG